MTVYLYFHRDGKIIEEPVELVTFPSGLMAYAKRAHTKSKPFVSAKEGVYHNRYIWFNESKHAKSSPNQRFRNNRQSRFAKFFNDTTNNGH